MNKDEVGIVKEIPTQVTKEREASPFIKSEYEVRKIVSIKLCDSLVWPIEEEYSTTNYCDCCISRHDWIGMTQFGCRHPGNIMGKGTCNPWTCPIIKDANTTDGVACIIKNTYPEELLKSE